MCLTGMAGAADLEFLNAFSRSYAKVKRYAAGCYQLWCATT
jgi:hypothetical protein